jgi:flagellar biosynthesis protein FlhB
VSDHDESDKTEEPTPDKRKQARDEGQFARAKDTSTMAASLVVLAALVGFGGTMYDQLEELARYCFSQSHSYVGGDLRIVMTRAVTTLAFIAGPILLLAVIAAIGAGFAESGFYPRLELAAPKFERLNPISKLGQMFSPKAAASQTVLSLLRVGVVAYIAYAAVKDSFPLLVSISRAPLVGGVGLMVEVITRVALWSTLGLVVMTAADYGMSWFRTERELKMSRQELKEEMHQQEGDPKIKARQRARARELSRRNVQKEVSTASVIITNPTHIAIAIRYKAEEGAPVVAAKGYDEQAMYIRKLAKEAGIPILENKPLARALAEKVKVGRVIPADLYAAVAEVLAWVYRLKSRGLRA